MTSALMSFLLSEMHILFKALIFTLFLTKTHQNIQNNESLRAGRRLLDFRKMMKVFVSVKLYYTDILKYF